MQALNFLKPGPLQKKPEGEIDWLHDLKHLCFESGKKKLLYRLHEPKAETELKFPLVLWLHGIKGRGADNLKQLGGGDNEFGPGYFTRADIQSRFPAYVVAPQCPGNKFWLKFSDHTSTRYLRWTTDLLTELIENKSIDPARIYVVGQSMGGFATWTLLTEYPDLFAAGIPVSGGGNPRKARKNLQAAVWAFHGSKDRLVRIWRSKVMVNALEKGGMPLRFTEFSEGKHDIWPAVFTGDDLADWLFAQRRKTE